jgi:hypothetical protein
MIIRLWCLLAATACGGEVVGPDASTGAPVPAIDLTSHWGECCSVFSQGGLGMPCVDAGDDGSALSLTIQCDFDQYCGLMLRPMRTAQFDCCGSKERWQEGLPGLLGSGAGTQCVPWPAAATVGHQYIDHHWGECCYTDLGAGIPGACSPDADTSHSDFGQGGLPWDASSPHIQCSSDQYCGWVNGGGPGGTACCGSRAEDQGTPQASGMDPSCPPSQDSL